MRSLICNQVIGDNNPEDAIARIQGVAQVLDHFSAMGGIEEQAQDEQMYGMLAAVLNDAVATVELELEANRTGR